MGDLRLDGISFSGYGNGTLMLGGVNYTRSGGGSGDSYPKFKDFYTIPSQSTITGTKTAGYVMRGLFGASANDNYWHICTDNDPLIYYDTSNNTLVRGDRWVSSGYFTNFNLTSIWYENKPQSNTPNPTRATGTGISSISVSNLGDYLYLRTVDILDQNGNVVLEANCTFADLGIE